MLPHLVGILPLPEAFAPVRGARIEKFKVEVFLNRAATTPKQRREMTEEREFWGIGTPRAWKYNPLLRGTGTSPERKPLRLILVVKDVYHAPQRPPAAGAALLRVVGEALGRRAVVY